MANLLKPSVDQAVFGLSSHTHPVRRRPSRDHNLSFLAEDEGTAPFATSVARVFRAVGPLAVIVVGLSITGWL